MVPKYDANEKFLGAVEDAEAMFSWPLGDLLDVARQVHKKHFDPNAIQISTLLNIKTGSCPENCSYCPQSAHYDTGLKKEPLMSVEAVVAAAQQAQEAGATRFCMGAAWRGPKDEQIEVVSQMVRHIKQMGMETCATLGLLKEHQAVALKEAGLDFYNHNIDTSENYYDKIITTRTFADRVETLGFVEKAGIQTCCGGIIGMGESVRDRSEMLHYLATMENPPMSVPINKLIQIPGTPLEGVQGVEPLDFVRTIAVARILLPKSYVRLSAGREQMSEELQALCFYAGANSIFYGEKLLTAKNPIPEEDNALFSKIGLKPMRYAQA